MTDHDAATMPTLRRTDVLAALGVTLVVAGVALLLSRTSIDNYDGQIMGQVATGIVDRHSIVVRYDAFHLNTPHSFYGIGMSLLMIPGILGSKVVGTSEAAGIMITNVWLLGLLGGAAYVWCRLRPLTVRLSAAVALVIALGLGMLPFASTGFAEVALALAVLLGMIGLRATARHWSWGPVLVGVAAGAAIVTRDDSIVLVVPWLLIGCLLQATAGQRIAALRGVVLGGLPFLALWAWYNTARWGSPVTVGYDGILRFNHSFLAGVYGLVLSPGRGLVLYAPVVLVALWGLRRSYRRDRVSTAVAVLLVLSRIVFYAPYWGWYAGGGFGPRYVLPAVPALGLGLMEVASRFGEIRRPARIAVAALAALSVGIGFVGGAVSYENDSLETALAHEQAFHRPLTTAHAFLSLLESSGTQRIVDRHMFDWSEFPITNETDSLFHRTDMASDGLSRPADKLRDALALAVFVFGAGLLVAVRRRTAGVMSGSSPPPVPGSP
jgi:hypothetical protein